MDKSSLRARVFLAASAAATTALAIYALAAPFGEGH
jgi:hypothetical protein